MGRRPSVRIGEIDGGELAERALDKCLRWSNPIRPTPGKYTVVLEPTAVGDLVTLIGGHLSARAAEQGQSFLVKRAAAPWWARSFFPRLLRFAQTLSIDATALLSGAWAAFPPCR